MELEFGDPVGRRIPPDQRFLSAQRFLRGIEYHGNLIVRDSWTQRHFKDALAMRKRRECDKTNDKKRKESRSLSHSGFFHRGGYSRRHFRSGDGQDSGGHPKSGLTHRRSSVFNSPVVWACNIGTAMSAI